MAAGYAEGVGDFLARDLEHVGQFVGRRLALVLLLELGKGLVDLIERSDLVERQAHDAALLGKCLEDALADPPHGVGDEFEAAGLVEFFCCLDQAEVSFVDQVREADALVLILFGDRDDEAQVGACQFIQGFLVSFLNSLCEFDFFFDGDQFFATDLLQVFVKRCTLSVGDRLGNL